MKSNGVTKVCRSPSCISGGSPQYLEAFSKNKSKKDGLETYCRSCRAVPSKPTAPDVVTFEKQEAPPPLPPLENAYVEAEERDQKNKVKRQHDALLKENLRLKAEVATFTRAKREPNILVYDKSAEFRSDAIACALASDWHVEEPVDKASVMGLNEYNLDVATFRAQNFFKNFLRLTDIMARDSKITTMHLSVLGDLFSGWLHEELRSGNLLAPGDASVFVSGLLCSGIDFLLRESSFRIEVDALPGNHGRMTEKMHFNDPTGTSLETVMYHMVAARYEKEPRVNFRVAGASEVHVRFFEKFLMRLIHGYEINFGGGVGGLSIPLNKRLGQWNATIAADLTCLGHFHQMLFFPKAVVNGSLIGYNNYAKHFGFTYEPPQQAFFLVHARKGGQRSVCAPIWLDSENVPVVQEGKER